MQYGEHIVLPDGKNPDTLDDGSFRCVFEETNGGLFVARDLSVDAELNVTDDIRNCDLEDTAYNFARGHYTVGKEIIDKVNGRMRKLIDNCDNVQGFAVNHSVSGCTGLGA